MDQALGQIIFTRPPNDSVFIRERWNPHYLTRNDRQLIVKALREIADAMDLDEFEHKGYKRYFKPAEESSK